MLKTGNTWYYYKHREVDEREMTKWQCVICGRIVPKYSLVFGSCSGACERKGKGKIMNIGFYYYKKLRADRLILLIYYNVALILVLNLFLLLLKNLLDCLLQRFRMYLRH